MALDLGPGDTRALLNRSVAYQELGQLDLSLADATTAIDLGVEDVEILGKLYLVRVLTYGEMGRFDEAVEDATAAIDLEPLPGVLAQMYVLRAEAFAASGRLDDAAADLELAKRASPYAEPDVQQVRDRYGIPGLEPVDHQADLATGETPRIAQMLVDVEGYSYVDIWAGELDYNLAELEEFEAHVGDDLVVASWHPVVADDPSQNTASNVEVGFLELLQRTASTDHDLLVEHVRTFWRTGEPLEEFDVVGVAVRVFENPDVPNSRYIYMWAIDDVSGVIDGADREPLERWLTTYLDELTAGDE